MVSVALDAAHGPTQAAVEKWNEGYAAGRHEEHTRLERALKNLPVNMREQVTRELNAGT